MRAMLLKNLRKRKVYYRIYQFDWLIKHDYRLIDACCCVVDNVEPDDDCPEEAFDRFEENGFSGELYSSFDEFCENEFLNAPYMYSILREEDCIKYQQWTLITRWLPTQKKYLNMDQVYTTILSVPRKYLMPKQLCWTWNENTERQEVIRDILKG